MSTETIYQSLYVQSRGALRRELAKCLRTGRALRRPSRAPGQRKNRILDMVNISERPGWPKGMRVIVRKERPHPGAQLRFTDADGMRLTAFATNTARGQLADLELRHRRRARCEDRIRCAKDTGLMNLPLHEMDQNRIWCAIVSLACEITAWLQMLALTGHQARRWEPKRLRLRLFSAAGRLAISARRAVLHVAAHGAWSDLLRTAATTLRALAAPG